MAVIAQGSRDLEPIAAALGPWLTDRWLDGAAARVTGVVGFGAGGVSNETLRVSFVHDPDESAEQVVLRLPPVGRGVFPHYDLEREHRIIEALHAAGIPVAGPAVHEADPAWIGEPFLAMPFKPGLVPAGQPRPYVLQGWLHDLAPQAQGTVLARFTDVLADIHALDPGALGIAPIGSSADGATGSASERVLGWWTDYLEWAAVGNDPAQVEGVAACFDWCRRYLPADEPPTSFAWGDARLGNVAFHEDLTVSAAFDWEAATLAPAEFDLGFHVAHRLNMAELVDLGTLPELPGFPPPDRQLERYEARLGRKTADLGWYTVVAAAGLATCRLAVQSALATAGRPPLPGVPLRAWVPEVMARYGLVRAPR